MARVETIVVGGGIGAGSPFDLNHIPYIASVDPPLLVSSPNLVQVPTGNIGVFVSTLGTDPDATATEVLRVKGGLISRPVGTSTTSNVIGKGSTIANGLSFCIAIGDNAVVTGTGTTLIGSNSSSAANNGALVVGPSIIVSAGYNNFIVAMGSGFTVPTGAGGSSGNHVYIGTAFVLTGTGGAQDNVLIGNSITTSSGNGANVVIGNANTIGNADSVTVVGFSNNVSFSTLSPGIMLGRDNDIGHQGCILLGNGLISTSANQCMIGGSLFSGAGITSLILGKGDTHAVPLAVTLRLTNGVGADINGGSLTLQAGLGTGAGVPGVINLQTSVAQGSSSTLQTATAAARFDGNQSAGESRFMLWDIDNNVLSRVSFGTAVDVGFKVLQIPV
ncbi:MAG: hypothetical protein ACRDRF_00660 [Pseudonocardiaceae bacterium]